MEEAREVLGDRVRQKQLGGAKMHLEQHIKWRKLKEWISRRNCEDAVFRRLEDRCRISRERKLRKLYDRPMEGWRRQYTMTQEAGRKAKYHWDKFLRSKEHSWTSSMTRLRAAQRAGGKVIHEAFKVAKSRMDKAGIGRMQEVYRGDDPKGEVISKGGEMREEVAKMAEGINEEGMPFMEAVRWWEERVWGASKSSVDARAWGGARAACTF